ncbi:MAG: SGNH/GDSL hydrolase family protein [Spirochaetota bacterium]
MQMTRVSILLMLAATALSAGSALTNGGFDEGDSNAFWMTDAGDVDALFTRDTQVKYAGDASLRITVPPTEKKAWPNAYQKIAVREGEVYLIEFVLKTDGVTRGAYLSGDCLDEKGSRISYTGSSLVSGTVDWKKYSVRVTVPAKAVSMQVKTIVYGSGTAWFDDITAVRDERTEEAMLALKKPLPTEWFSRALVSDGNNTRIKRIFAKAARGEKTVIGVIGGSITQGASASSADKRYAAHLLKWWQEHFPNAQCVLVNAGIGATSSDYGALRVERDLLSKNPDCIVVEYAVNDMNTQERAESYEGVIRRILTHPSKPGVLLMFMVKESGDNAQEWQSKIGAHYGLPMVSYRDLLWPEIEAKRIAWKDISPDNIHPNDRGHAYAGKLLGEMLDRLRAAPDSGSGSEFPAPLLTDMYQFTKLIEADAITPVVNEGWALESPQDMKCLRTVKPGSVLEIEMSGERIFLSFWVIRGPMGKAKISIDGGEPTIADAWFDQTWGGYRRMIMLDPGKGGMHRILIEVLAEKNPLSTGNEFRVMCIGAAGVRGN